MIETVQDRPGNASAPKAAFRQFSAWFNEKPVLKEIDLEIGPVGRLALIGPANSGKTTLLRSLNRLLDLTPGFRKAGAIFLDGQDIFDPKAEVASLRRRVGLVSSASVSLPGSVFDNIALALKLAGERRSSRLVDAVEQSLGKVWLWEELKDHLEEPALHLPTGVLRRLALARALAFEPEMLLLDEPCSGLDYVSATLLEDVLEQLSAHCPVVFATNDIKQAARASDQTAFLLSGKLVEVGPAQKIFTKPTQSLTSDFITERF